MFLSFGLNHFAIVNFNILPSHNSKGFCTDHFPYDFSQTKIALLYSLNARLVISEADAELQFIKTTIFLSKIHQIFVLEYSSLKSLFLYFVVTTKSHFFINSDNIVAALSKYQPQLFLKSIINPFIFFSSNFFNDL
jgi:hypothetical protein